MSPAAGRLSEARAERAGDQRLVAAPRRAAPTTWPSSARCGPPTTTTAPSCSSTPAGTCSKASFPTIGSWVHYGLGSLNDNLPQFVVLGTPLADCCGGMEGHGANYLGPRARRRASWRVDPNNPLPFAAARADVFREEQQPRVRPARPAQPPRRRSSIRDDPTPCAPASSRTSWRSACRRPCPRSSSSTHETAATHAAVRPRPERDARRSASNASPRGGWSSGACGSCRSFTAATAAPARWDAHGDLQDQPQQALQRGRSADRRPAQRPQAARPARRDARRLGTEFGRTPGPQGADGRDHHPYGFSVWLAGGGIKGGIVHGATDELGFHAVENRHYVTDIHATVLHQLGLDPRRLEIPGRKRLEMDYGEVIREMLA